MRDVNGRQSCIINNLRAFLVGITTRLRILDAQPLDNPQWERFAQAVAQRLAPETAYLLVGFATQPGPITQAAASRLMAQPEVHRRVCELLEPALRKAKINVQGVIDEYAKLAFSNIDDYLRTGEDGTPEFDYAATTRAQRAAIGEITIEETTEGKGKDARPVRRVKFKLHGKQAALDSLAKIMKLYSDAPVLDANVVSLLAKTDTRQQDALIAGLQALLPLQIEGDVVRAEDEN